MADSSPGARLTLTEQLELVLPTGSRSRRFAQAGLVVWAAIGVALLVGFDAARLATLETGEPVEVAANSGSGEEQGESEGGVTDGA